MNLYYLVAKKHARLSFSSGVSAGATKLDGVTWLGVNLPGGGEQLTLRKATECQPFRERPDVVGWFGCAPHGPVEIEVLFVGSSSGLVMEGTYQIRLEAEPTAIRMPWPSVPVSEELDLVIRTTGETLSPAFIAVYYPLNRTALLALCKGRGVEVGPGPKPQVRPAPDTEVFYIERSSPEVWTKLYGADYAVSFDFDLLPLYKVGDAHEIPADPESLDFIFSSHVFEHLANPIGHLEIWFKLLRPGGRIVMVVPDYIGSKDFLVNESSLDELVAEYKVGEFEITDAHYERFGRARGSAKIAKKSRSQDMSIHVHYYTKGNTTQLCEFACDHLGYSNFAITHSQNHKDFYVVIER